MDQPKNIPKLSKKLSMAVRLLLSLLAILHGRSVHLLDKDETYRTYWALFGGWRSIVHSKYPYVSALVTTICAPYWLSESEFGIRSWAQTAIDVIPSLMGFTLGGMAILLAFSNEKFLQAIRAGGDPHSLFMKCVAAFFHFLLLQSISLICAFISFAHSTDWLSAAGFFFLVYGLLASLAIAGMLLQISRIFNAAGSLPDHSVPGKSPEGED